MVSSASTVQYCNLSDDELLFRAITRDENLYPDPFKFDPGRFMGSSEEVLKRRKAIRNNVFGFGRRYFGNITSTYAC